MIVRRLIVFSLLPLLAAPSAIAADHADPLLSSRWQIADSARLPAGDGRVLTDLDATLTQHATGMPATTDPGRTIATATVTTSHRATAIPTSRSWTARSPWPAHRGRGWTTMPASGSA